MAQSPIATAADYADAMMAARKAKNGLVLLLLLMLLAQLAIFFSMRHWPELLNAARNPVPQTNTFKVVVGLQCLVALIDFMGIALTVVLALVLLLIVGIMLVGRLIGVARVTSAYVWCIALGVLLFPWQSFLSNSTLRPAGSGAGPVVAVATTLPTTQLALPAFLPPDQDFKVPGVLYTWGELIHPTLGASFSTDDHWRAGLHWARYAGFPILAVILLLTIQVRSSRGLRMALGEVEIDVDLPETRA